MLRQSEFSHDFRLMRTLFCSRDNFRNALIERFFKPIRRSAFSRNAALRKNVEQRSENKRPLVHAGMRHFKPSCANDLIAPQQNVQIKRSRSVAHPGWPYAAVHIFKPLQLIEKGFGRKPCFHCAHSVDVIGPGRINRRGSVKGALRRKHCLRQPGNFAEHELEHPQRIAQIRPQSQYHKLFNFLIRHDRRSARLPFWA